MTDLMAHSTYPHSLDVCSTCSMRVAGFDVGTAPNDHYRETAAKYSAWTTTGARIEPIDDEDGDCHLCGEPRFGETFDVTARPFPTA